MPLSLPLPLPPELVLALVGFAFVTSITPGPNNLMMLASGANYGVRRTVPHMLGIAVGFTVMVALVGVGLMGLFDAFPALHGVLRVASVVYMLWLAWKIATAAPLNGEGTATGRPLTFLQAAAFQWVNPKAWAMALGAIAAYAPTRSLDAVVAVALIFGAVNLPSVGAWAVLGQSLRALLAEPRRLRLFNGAMAALLVLSVLPVVTG